MEIRRIQPAELSSTYELLAQSGWHQRLGDQGRFAILVEASQLAEVAIVGGQVVGFLRGITDGLSNGYLSMVVVAPRYRSMGIGRKLVEHAVGGNPQVTWVLRAGREGASEFFGKLGFEASSLAMERRRA